MFNSGSKLVGTLFRANQATVGVLKSCQKHASLTARELQYDNPEAETGPLMNRFMRSIALDNVKTLPIVPREIKYSNYYPVLDHRAFMDQLRKTDISQLSRLLIYTTNYKSNADMQKFVRVINDLDTECQRRIDRLEYTELFQLMYYFMLLTPNRITQLDYFRRAIERMVADFANHEENRTQEHFVQIAFYLGMLKKNRHGMDMLYNFLNGFLDDYLDQLDEIGFAMVANAAFKCSLKVSNERFNERLAAEVLKYEEDSQVDIQLLITFIKSMRHNRVMSTPVLDKVDALVCGEALSEADFRGYAHLFALFAESRQISKKLATVLNEKCMRAVEKEHRKMERDEHFQMTPEFRQKDLRMFLWANAFLNLPHLSRGDLEKVTEFFLHQVGQEEPYHKLDDLVDASLSLAMLKEYPKRLISMVQKEGSFYKQSNNQNRAKLDSRFFLLTSSVAIEAPQLMTEQWKGHQSTDFTSPAPEYLVKNRDFFLSLQSVLEGEARQLGVAKVSTCVPIKHSNIASYVLEMENGSSVLVEVLDRSNTLTDGQTPHGIMALKLRLLGCLGRDVVLVSEECIRGKGEVLIEVSFF